MTRAPQPPAPPPAPLGASGVAIWTAWVTALGVGAVLSVAAVVMTDKPALAFFGVAAVAFLVGGFGLTRRYRRFGWGRWLAFCAFAFASAAALVVAQDRLNGLSETVASFRNAWLVAFSGVWFAAQALAFATLARAATRPLLAMAAGSWSGLWLVATCGHVAMRWFPSAPSGPQWLKSAAATAGLGLALASAAALGAIALALVERRAAGGAGRGGWASALVLAALVAAATPFAFGALFS